MRPFDDFPHAVVFRDSQGRIGYVNRAAERLLGLEPYQIIGKSLADVLGEKTAHTRIKRTGVQVVAFRRRDGHQLHLEHWAHAFDAVRGERHVPGTIDVLLDVTERIHAERSLKEQTAFIALLQEVAVAANESASVQEALKRSLDCICGHTGWPVGHVYMLPHRGADELVPWRIWHIELPRRFDRFRKITEATRMPRGVGLPGSVLATGKPLWVMDVRHHPNFPRARAAQDIGVRAGFAFPILVGRETVGVLEFFAPKAIEPDPALLASMAQVGTQLGRVIERAWAEGERAQLLARERAAHAEAEAAERRVAFLYDATTRLIAESLDSVTTLETISRVALPTFADWCVVDLCGDGQEGRVVEAHVDGNKVPLVSQFYSLLRTHPSSPVQQAHHTGKPVRIVDLSMHPWARTGRLGKLRAQLGTASLLAIPLYARTRGFGLVCFGAGQRYYTSNDEALAEDLGHRIALAIDNLRLFSQAQSAVKAREDVLAAISHDLRTPASSIVTTTELLESDLKKIDTRTRDRLGRIRRSGLRMIRMITSLLDQARIEAGILKLELSADLVHWPDLLAEAIESVEPLAGARQIRIERSRPVAKKLVCDRDRLLQVLTNVLSNAIKFTPSNGQVDVHSSVHKGELVLTVTDRCGGIDVQELPYVFERFFRGQRDANTAGTGLGLFIAKGIVEAHGGRIRTENAPKIGGCRFTIAIPLAGPPRKGAT